MNKKFGHTISQPVTIPAVYALKLNDDDPDIVVIPEKVVWQQALLDGTPWQNAAKAKEGTWFIAVNDWGQIIACEADPTMCAVTKVDIWQITHPGPDTAIRGSKWTGKEVVPWPVSPEQ